MRRGLVNPNFVKVVVARVQPLFPVRVFSNQRVSVNSATERLKKMMFANSRANSRKTLIWAFFSLIVFALMSCNRVDAEQTVRSSSPGNDKPIVVRWKDYTVLSQTDQVRLGSIQNTIYRRHTVTDADLNFALKKLKSDPVVREGDNKLSLQCMVLTSLIGRKDFTKPQVDRFLQAVVPFAYSANSTVAGYAAIAIGSLRNARAIPVLEKIVQSTKNRRVRQNASQKLFRLKELAAAGEI